MYTVLLLHFFKEQLMSETHKFCSKCGVFKPKAEFKRLLSRAQTIAKGYAGAFKVEIESTRCKPCQPKQPPLKSMTPRKLRQLVSTGDANPHIVDTILKERDDNRGVDATRQTKERWHDAYRWAWRALVKDVGLEITKMRYQQQYALRRQYEERLDYVNTYILILELVRARFRKEAMLPQGAPASIYWQHHVRIDEVATIQTAFKELSDTAKGGKGKGFEQGALLKYVANPPPPMKPRIRLANGEETLASPAARLAHGDEDVNPLTLLDDAALEKLLIAGHVPSPVINVVLEERARKARAEALGRADKDFNKRVARRVAEASVPTKAEKKQRQWVKKLQPVARPPAPEAPRIVSDRARLKPVDRIAGAPQPELTQAPAPEKSNTDWLNTLDT
jgi:hypothetical protein